MLVIIVIMIVIRPMIVISPVIVISPMIVITTVFLIGTYVPFFASLESQMSSGQIAYGPRFST